VAACDSCGRTHEAPGTLGAALECLAWQIDALPEEMQAALRAQHDQLTAKLRHERDRRLGAE